MKQKPVIYPIPIGEKFIIYAPLKSIAFIGNKALMDAIDEKLKHPATEQFTNSDAMKVLQKTRLFEPDNMRIPDCKNKDSFQPTLCILMTTTNCNLACTYCYASYKGKKRGTLKWAIAKKAIDTAFENARKFKKSNFSLSFHGGGEPTFSRALFLKAAGYAKKLDPACPVSVTTNAVWDSVFREKALDLIHEISVSFDGNHITQNRQRPDTSGAGTFTRVMETIREIEQRNIPYGIRMTVTKESLPELQSNIEFLCSHTNCPSFQIEAVYNQGRAVGAGITIDDVDTFTETFMDVYDYAKGVGKSVYYSSARPHLITNAFCSAASDALIVTSDGEITACYEVFDHSHVLAKDFIIGRMDVHEGIFLHPDIRVNLLKKIAANRKTCKTCFCYYHCAGDCPPKSFISRKNNDSFRCSVTRSITRELILEQIAESGGLWLGSVNKLDVQQV